MSSNIDSDNSEQTLHKLQNKWTLWAHLPHDTDWSINSYKLISTFGSVEEAIVLFETIPDIMVTNCMLFLMKDKINPTWEDIHNRKGGSFSYKVTNKNVCEVWKDLTYVLVGETISTNLPFVNSVTGITISPKKNFCIVKIWLSSCEYQDASLIDCSNEIGIDVIHQFQSKSVTSQQKLGTQSLVS